LHFPGAAYKLASIIQRSPDFFDFCIWFYKLIQVEIETVIPPHKAADRDIKANVLEGKIFGINKSNGSILYIFLLYPRVSSRGSTRTDIDADDIALVAHLSGCWKQ
jgi:hypothetical protein